MKRRIICASEFPYVYKLYDTQGSKRKFIKDIGASSPKSAVKQAGFDNVESNGGHIEYARKGTARTNSFINVYLYNDVESSNKPSFVLERVFNQ